MKKLIFNVALLILISFASLAQTEWHITGNSGTSPGTNFVGTTDNKNLVFKINNSISGIIDNVNSNTSLGYKTLSVNTSAANTAIGYGALQNNTGTYLDNSGANTAVGSVALYSNTTGAGNVAIGALAANGNLTGSANVAIGNGALQINSSGYDNTAIGYGANSNSTTGFANSSLGYFALNNNTTGTYNNAFGLESLYNNTTSSYSCAFGYRALYANIGANNVGFGYEALYSNSTGTNNTAIGYAANVNNTNYTNATALGNGALGTASNQVRVGNASVTSIGGYVGWSNISDARVKKNIKEDVPGLAFINSLRAVTYNYDFDAADKVLNPLNQNTLTQEEIISRQTKQKTIYTGFIAQEVEKAAKNLNYNFSGVDVPKNDKDLYSLRYSEFVVPLVKAVQELSKKNDSKDSLIQQMNNKIETLHNQIDQIQAQLINPNLNKNNESLSLNSGYLFQNTPNPFTGITTITYTLPPSYSSAQLIITDKSGIRLKTFKLNGQGKNDLQLDVSTLAAGAYQYSLIINGKKIDTKQMIYLK